MLYTGFYIYYWKGWSKYDIKRRFWYIIFNIYLKGNKPTDIYKMFYTKCYIHGFIYIILEKCKGWSKCVINGDVDI